MINKSVIDIICGIITFLDLRLWNERMVLMAEKELQIVDLDGTVIRKYGLVRRPTSLQVLGDEAFVADRSGDVYQEKIFTFEWVHIGRVTLNKYRSIISFVES